MKKTKIIYYIFTVLLSASMLMSAYFELSGDVTAQEGMIHLGYPVYLNYILGVAKILGVIAVWQTIYPTLKEWAYAGFTIDLVGAVVSILAVGDPFSMTVPALINMLFLIVSYIAYRKLQADRGQITTIRV